MTVYSDGESNKALISTGRLSSDTQHFDFQDLVRLRELFITAKGILDNPDTSEAEGKRHTLEIAVKPEVVQPENAVPPRAVPQARPKAKAQTKTKAKTKTKG